MKTRLLITGFFLLSLFYYTANSQTYRLAVTPEGTNKSGYVNLKGEFIIEAQYFFCFDFTEDGTALIINKGTSSTKIYLFDRMGNQITPETKIKLHIEEWTGNVASFHGGILRLKQNGKWGGINTDGKFSVAAIYNELTDFDNGYALGIRDKVYYVVDKNGNETRIENNDNITYIKHFTEGLAPVETKGKIWGYIDTSGRFVIAPQFKTVGYFSGGIAWARIKDKTIGFINKKGEWVIEPQFAGAKRYDKESGLAMVKKRSSDMHWEYVDTTGNIQDFKLAEDPYNFSNGLAIGKKNYKYGYLNNKGEWAITAVFNDAHDFINGYAAVKKGKRWGLINKEGDWILQPEYKFIGNVAVIGSVN